MTAVTSCCHMHHTNDHLTVVTSKQSRIALWHLQELSDRLKEEASRTADAIAAADTARQQQHVLQAELAAAQTTARMVPGLQVGGGLLASKLRTLIVACMFAYAACVAYLWGHQQGCRQRCSGFYTLCCVAYWPYIASSGGLCC
jgi:hypothetical protein